jgi:tripartite-type tricarboxylate transporter receptor subunit TctC
LTTFCEGVKPLISDYSLPIILDSNEMKGEREVKKMTLGSIVFLFTLIIGGACSDLGAADFPTRPIEIIAPNAAGGGMDFVLTLFKGHVEKVLKQPLIITYKPGASGLVGNMYAKSLKPDGYSLVAESTSSLLLAVLSRSVMSGKSPDYTLDDFTAISNLTIIPQVFCVKEDSPYKTMRDFIEAAKNKKMQFSTFGSYSTAHIIMEALGKMAGFKPLHVPFPGAAAAMTAALGGHVDMAISATTAFVGPGKLRLLAVSSLKRLEGYPEVPTLTELGYPINGQEYYSIWGPKNIPEEIAGKLYEAIQKAFKENIKEITGKAREQQHTISLLNGRELRKTCNELNDFYTKFLTEHK